MINTRAPDGANNQGEIKIIFGCNMSDKRLESKLGPPTLGLTDARLVLTWGRDRSDS